MRRARMKILSFAIQPGQLRFEAERYGKSLSGPGNEQTSTYFLMAE